MVPLTYGGADLLEDYELDTDVRHGGDNVFGSKVD